MANKYAVTLTELERSAHVALEDQVTELDTTPPHPDLLAEAERERNALLRVAGV